MKKLLFVIFAFMSGAQVNAATTTIGFDDYKGNGEIGNYYEGLTFVNANYSFLNLPGQNTPGGINYNNSYYSKNPIEVYFENNVDYVSVTGIDIGFNGFKLSAFNDDGDLVDYKKIYGKGDGVGQYYILELFGIGISKVAFSQLDIKLGDGALYDNFTYGNISATPIPATAFMFAPALLGVLGLRHKAKLAA